MRGYEAGVSIDADPPAIWSVLVDAPGYATWDSGVERVEGRIAPGERLKVYTKLPKRTVPVRVTEYLPDATLGAVVIVAATALVDVSGMIRMWRMSRIEFGLAAAAFLGVALVGVLQGVLVAIGLSFVAVVARAWQPYRTELVQTSDRPGFHDIERHPDGQRIPGLVLVRFDAPLFFANGDIFDNYVRSVVAASETPVEWVVIAAEALTGLDTTAVDEVVDLDTYLDGKGIHLVFAEMKGPIKDRLIRFGLSERFDAQHFYPTIEAAVAAFRSRDRD